MVLLVQKNNAGLLQNQIAHTGFGCDAEHFSGICRSAENTLGLIAIAAVFIGAIGGLCLIGFRNQSTEKSIAMMYIFGMQKKDLVLKAFLDAAVYAFLSSCVWFCCGYLLFLHFSKQILEVEVSWTLVSLQSMALFSLQSAVVFLETFGLIAFLIFLGNLFIDLRITERSIVQILYGRKGAGGKQNNYRYILAGEILGILLYSLLIFHVKAGYLFTAGLVVTFLAAALFFAFHIFLVLLRKRAGKTGKLAR